MPTPNEFLFDALRLRSSDTTQLSRTIRRRYSEAYKGAISAELQNLGRDERGNNPAGAELETIRGFVDRDVESIVGTYHRELQSQIDRQIASNPTATLSEHRAALSAWEANRSAYKMHRSSTRRGAMGQSTPESYSFKKTS